MSGGDKARHVQRVIWVVKFRFRHDPKHKSMFLASMFQIFCPKYGPAGPISNPTNHDLFIQYYLWVSWERGGKGWVKFWVKKLEMVTFIIRVGDDNFYPHKSPISLFITIVMLFNYVVMEVRFKFDNVIHVTIWTYTPLREECVHNEQNVRVCIANYIYGPRQSI